MRSTFLNLLVPGLVLAAFFVGQLVRRNLGEPTYQGDHSLLALESQTPVQLPAESEIAPNAKDAFHAVGLIRTRCVHCHQGDAPSGGLDLTSTKKLRRGGDSGTETFAALQGLLLDRVRDVEDPMPPEGEMLNAEEIRSLEQWLSSGASFPSYSDHWAFRPLPQAKITPEQLDQNLELYRQRLDLSELVAHKAPRHRLILRAYLDLTGLPPTQTELDHHQQNPSPDWFAALVDDLLQSPAFGERWAQFWLDQARYADSDGFEKDLVRPNAWRYRKWVIDALNNDLPFDRFVHQQIAGDLDAEAGMQEVIATGFLQCAPSNREGGTDPEKNRFEQAVDRVNSIGTIFLGISLECARCHDHPFEPITQDEYYGLVAAFDNCENHTHFAAAESQRDSIREYQTRVEELIEQRDLARLLQGWEDQLRFTSENYGLDNGWDNQWLRMQIYIDNARQILFRSPNDRTLQERVQILEFFLRESHDAYPAEVHDPWMLPAALEELQAIQESALLDQAMVIRESATPRETHLRERGDFYRPANVVEAGVPSSMESVESLATTSSLAPRQRIALWLVSDCEPLLARVMVNRIWAQLFGEMLVVDEDFGVQSNTPPLNDLLDTLAAQFVHSGWDFKQLIRDIMLTRTYQLDSKSKSESVDPLQDRQEFATFLVRQRRMRLSGEQLRDRMLTVAGLLNRDGGFRSFYPPQPAGTEQLSINPNPYWKTSSGDERNRRSLYIHKQRTSPFPFLNIYGASDGNAPCTMRHKSASPLQSLAGLNEAFAVDASRAVAQELLEQLPQSGQAQERHSRLWLKLFGRPPTDMELEFTQEFVRKQFAAFQADPTASLALARAQDKPELAAWTALARALMNTDSFLRRE